MKLEIFLFLFALGLAFLSGNISYFIHDDEKVDLKNIDEIQKLHFELQETMAPFIRIDLNVHYNTLARQELLKTIKSTHKSGTLRLDSTQCIRSKINQLSSNQLTKEDIWLAYLCDQINTLPRNYFETPPFIHSSGQSYAFLKYRMLSSPVRKLNWLESNAKNMHIAELKKIGWSQNSEQRFLNTLQSDLIDKIIQGEKLILTKEYYFINTGNLKYYVQTSDKALRFFNRARYLVNNNISDCSLRVASTCWSRKPHNLKSILTQSSYIIFAGTLVILFITAKGLLTRFRRRRYEEERKKHALRLLTHELRTPIASLLLQIDQINARLDEIPDDIIDDIMKIEGQVYRLKHLAEKSQSYLQTNNSDFLNLTLEKIDSLNQYLNDIKDEYLDLDIQIKTVNDLELTTDPYWLKVVISNIIENAKRYGKTPILIDTYEHEDSIIIEITDQGDIPYRNIKELLKNKHQNSKGLGIGMIIVTRIIKELGGKLSLDQSPTKFTIKLQKENDDKDSIS